MNFRMGKKTEKKAVDGNEEMNRKKTKCSSHKHELSEESQPSQKTEGIPERKKKRLMNKMRKTEAFLALARSNDEAELQEKESSGSDESDTELAAEKKKDKRKKNNAPILDTTSAQPSMTEEEIRAAIEEKKKEIIARQKRSMSRPKLFLTLENLSTGFDPKSSKDEEMRRPLYIMDIQQLLLNALQGQSASYKPQWCKLLRYTKITRSCLIILDQVTADDYRQNPELFPALRGVMAEVAVEFVPPERHQGSLLTELLTVPVSPNKLAVRQAAYRKKALQAANQQKRLTNQKLPPEVFQADLETALTRTFLLLSTDQLIQEGYPLPGTAKFSDFVYTQETYGEVTDESPIFALDCEMCLTTLQENELTRVSIVNEKMECVYDSFVKPRNKITNYLTKFSGITKAIMDPVTTRIEDVQRDIRALLPPDAILAGQSLQFDLKSLKMFHPYVIDTSVIYNLSGQRHVKTSLKSLTSIFLGKSIQADDKKGHSSVEDASATMELVNLKLKNGLQFGDVSASQKPLVQQIKESRDQSQSNRKRNSENDDCESKVKKLKMEKENVSNLEQSDGKCVSSHESSEENSKISDENLSDEKEDMSIEEKERERKLEEVRRAVFMNNKAKFIDDFFEVVAETGKSMCVVDSECLLEEHKSESLKGSLMICEKRKKRTEIACENVKTKDFTWVRYSGSKKRLSKLDGAVAKILDSLPDMSLVTVVLTGDKEHDGMVLSHIT